MSSYFEVEVSATGHSSNNSTSSKNSYDYRSTNREVFVTSPISSYSNNTSSTIGHNSDNSTTTSTTTTTTTTTSTTSASSVPRILYVFDFDWSLVDENSDTYVLEK